MPMPNAEIDLPAFSAIRVANIEPVLRELLDAHRAQLAALLGPATPSWDSLVVPLEEMHHRLARTWSPVGHMNGVVNSDELRAAYNACLPLLTAWHTELAQNERLYRAYETILATEGDRLTAGQRKLLQNALRDFRLAGVALPAEQKAEFKALVEQLATLQSKFDENVLDATNAWSRHVTQRKRDRRAAAADRRARTRRRAGAPDRRLVLHARCAELPGRDDACRSTKRCAASSITAG